MGKLLSLGPKLKYPITISKLLNGPGEKIQKQQTILQYSFKWMKEVGDPLADNVWQEELTTIVDFDSPVDGSVIQWKVREGQVVERDMPFIEVEEDCPHSVQFQGLCGMCGKDMTEMSWASASDDTQRAQINMIHDQTALRVSEDEASKAEEELQRRLLKHRKLSLVVDLDQTIIHACIEPTVGEWQNDPTSPNYEAVKDVKSFQLNDDGPRGLASGCWYYIKMRPGLKEFLSKISELYELHVYTMGTRAYALNIAKIVDPDKKLFGDRIISRDENGNVTAKSLARLFPVDTKMVVIIDDRADVWPKNRPNLIKVVPYDFFLGIGDINSSFLPKREEFPKITPLKRKPSDKTEGKGSEQANNVETATGEASTSKDTAPADGEIKKLGSPEDDGTRVSALEELVRMGGGDDQAKRQEQAAEQAKFLEKQITERPLLHLQEKLDQEDDKDATSDETKNGDTTHEHHKHNLLKDDDVELMYLEKHLSQLHKAFYDEYDSAVVSARGGRVAQLKPGHNKKLSTKEHAADLKIVPDIGHVMPRLKAKTFEGCTLVLSGLVPLNTDVIRSEIALQATSFGAIVQNKVTRKITHLVASTSRTRTNKVKQAAKYPHVKIINQQWLLDSMSKWEKQDETPYLVEVHESDRKPDNGNPSSLPSSIHDTDQSSEDSASQSGSDDDEDETVSGSQEEAQDYTGVIPDELEGGGSPIDDLKTFDWSSADNELDEFMNESDSDNESVASDSSRASGRSNGSRRSGAGERKRKHEDVATDDDDDSDAESTLAKKQRVANSRTTGLKTVKTPNSLLSESSLPTPGVTGDEDGDEADLVPAGEGGSDDEFDADLEAELTAAMERDEAEAAAAAAAAAANGAG